MKTALITLSDEGARLLAPLTGCLPEARLFIHESVRNESILCKTVLHETAPHDSTRIDSEQKPPVAERFTRITDLTASLFPVCRNLVYAAPCGVVVRAIAPLVKSKLEDPAVVVLDAGGRWAVSLLSGHESDRRRARRHDDDRGVEIRDRRDRLPARNARGEDHRGNP
jgi:cobalt-precorrin 5A hydrolase